MNDISSASLSIEPFFTLLYEEKGKQQHYKIHLDELKKIQHFPIGRKKKASGLRISEATISREHCFLSVNSHNQLFITDLASSNGTFVNNIRLKKHQKQRLNPNDKIILADTSLSIIFPATQEVTTTENEKTLINIEDSNKTVLGNFSALHDTPSSHHEKDTCDGKHVEQHNALIENILTFGARKSLFSFLLILLLTSISALGFMNLKMDTGYDSMFSTKDPAYADYEKVIDEFGSDNITIIHYQHNNLFTKDRLKIIKETTLALQDINFVETVESITNTLPPQQENIPQSQKELLAIKDNALSNTLINKNLISADGTKGAIVVTLKSTGTGADFNRKAYQTIENKIKTLKNNFDHVFQIGPPRLNVEIEQGMMSDMTLITPLATLILISCIVLLLRTSMAAILPLATAGLSVFWTLGFMGFANVPVNLLTAILPALIIVIGSTEDIHMLSAYLEGIRKQNTGNRFPAIRFMATHVGLPIFLTSLTTTIGFLSNSLSEISLISDFGIATSFAMVANLIATILVLPLLLQLFGSRHSKIRVEQENAKGIIPSIVTIILSLSENHQHKVLVVVSFLILLFGAFSFQVKVSNDPISYFKSDNQIVQDVETLHNNLAGMQVFFVTVHAQEGFDFKDPKELEKLESIQNFIDLQGVYDKSSSILDFIKLTHQELNQSNPSFYSIPDNRQTINQFFLYFERNRIERFISSDAKQVNLVVRHNLSDSSLLNSHLETLSNNLNSTLGNTNAFFLTGKNLMINKAAESLFISQLWSLGLLILIIFILMSGLYSSLTAGLVSIAPNIIPVIIMFGIMGMFNIPLNPGTAIVAVIAIGIALDDTIHLLTTYNNECRIDGDLIASATRSVKAEAIPVITTSIALAAGFLILTTSRFHIISQFGILSAITMIVSMITDLVFTPILLKNFRLVGVWDVISFKLGKDVLAQSEIFKGMTQFQIKRAVLLSQAREYEAGTEIIKQGDIGDALYIVISGEAEVVQFDGTFKKVIARLGWGEVFGEAGYIGASQRSATVRVPADGENVQVIILNKEKVDTAMRFYPRLRAKLDTNINKILTQRKIEISVV